MAYKEPARAAYLAVIIAQNCHTATPFRISLAVQAMQAAAKAAKADGVNRCNYPMTEKQEKRADKRLAKLEAAANEALTACGDQRAPMSLSFGGDPRGTCGRLIVAGQSGDGFGGDGYPIYD